MRRHCTPVHVTLRVICVYIVLLANVVVDCEHNACSRRSGRIAVLSVATPDFLSKARHGLTSKECWSLKHDYEWILYVADHLETRSPHWIRVLALNETLPLYDWVFYTDADTLITNETVRLEDYIAVAQSRPVFNDELPFIIVQDGMEINSGGFLIRNCPAAFKFLKAWWHLGERSRLWRFAITTYDQVPFVLTLLRYAFESRGMRYDEVCERRYWMSYNMFVGCWNSQMNVIGLPFGNRSHAGVHYHSFHKNDASVATGLRGFNTIYAVEDYHLASSLHPSHIWRPGDLLAHVTHSMTDSTDRRSHLLSAYFEANGFTEACPLRDEAWPSLLARFENVSACRNKPCLHDLWDDFHNVAVPAAAARRSSSTQNSNDRGRPCAANFGSLLGEDVCCGQDGVVESVDIICTDYKNPTCEGFVQNVRWGTCTQRSVAGWTDAALGYSHFNRWTGYKTALGPNKLGELARDDPRCPYLSPHVATVFLEAEVEFTYSDGRNSVNIFRMPEADDFESRLHDFVNEASSFDFFWGDELMSIRRNLLAKCMRIDHGLSAHGRFHPAKFRDENA